ncbi:MAG: hypothetical protein VR74_13475 [Hyphomonas sp. BRH_c22]|uniref:DUF1329 domain-containing protein n=1 Tax=Hyphomonas sp. BRH_c22 TaxID=1629710 RepID=UPI0005F1CF30|nr:DUF1329 domain-containing protein [Hyphomonas sp. BRH_c22]KJS36309.1 MAG: hypothetical protein VR74_13475 [Hyphomonas sp. BRH_c22]
MKLSSYLTGAAIAVLVGGSAAAQVVDDSFYPYANGAPTYSGLTAGMTIDQSNVAQFSEILDPALEKQISDGWLAVTVGETTSFDLHPNYIKATRDGYKNVSLGDAVGQINGFVAGRPFPQDPSMDDPRAGEKLAWNFQYGYNWGDNAAIAPFYWKFKDLQSGKIERTIKFNFHFLNFKHRVNQDPLPEVESNPDDIFRAIYLQVLEPFDLKNTQLLIYRYADDLKQSNAWLYLGFQRRVRRLATGQVTDSFLGSDLMIEDFEGYNGSISQMKWTYQGTKNVLLPFFNHNDLVLSEDNVEKDGYKFVDFGGQGGCYPNVTWQLRKVYVLESDPVDDNHPVSKRVHYVDAQTYTLPRTLIYDRKGDLWKTFTIGQAHPDHHDPINKGSGVSIDDAFSMLDVQAGHCTTGHFRGRVDSKLNPQSKFTVQNLRATGK